MPQSIRHAAYTVALAAALLALPVAASAATALVVNNRDEGAGSFRQAIELASNNPSFDTIQFLFTVGTVRLKTTVVYTGTQALVIQGAGATLDGSLITAPVPLSDPPTTDGVAFAATGYGDLAISNLNIRNAPSEGLAMLVPSDETGTVRLWLFNVAVVGNEGHGVLVNDQETPSTPDTDPPTRPIAAGSPARLEVTVLSSRFIGNGFGALDRDGLRVNEGGPGDLKLTVRLSAADDNGADGIEIDERGDGNVVVDMFSTRLSRNGNFSSDDFDDGFDIDELDGGDILGQIVFSSANDNFEQGFDFNENDAGDLKVNMLLVEANNNAEEGIEYEEDDDFGSSGSIIVTIAGVRANGNCANDGDGGFKLREKGAGDLIGTVSGVQTLGNTSGGIYLREASAGVLNIALSLADSRQNGGNGITFDEGGANDAASTIANSVARFNGAAIVGGVDLLGIGTGSVTVSASSIGTTAGPLVPTP